MAKFLLRRHTLSEGAVLALIGSSAICLFGFPDINLRNLFIAGIICFICCLISLYFSMYLKDICFLNKENRTEEENRRLSEELYQYEERYDKDASFFLIATGIICLIGISLLFKFPWIVFLALIAIINGIKGRIQIYYDGDHKFSHILNITAGSYIIGMADCYKHNQDFSQLAGPIIQGIFMFAVIAAAIFYLKQILDEYKREGFNYECKELLLYFLLHLGLIAWNILFYCILKL